ncbi:bifunctional glycosyltransferase family 2/GtrA family protein [Grimontia sp. NTOU-MAR1]|uniref:bifunctional glycosyltransferase family 2/GtrA family protein n=1 Tax=Grimontia sp. NTOU-MAR1 TaxID=3111011 RepID=UPI002DB5B446|nr:bifunctional glycosyltransferase family 2/GtrA family protein [Grimontia sp. NTOU-MAR1]WRV97519.1 bifunctional glycosyltransferase family 2/GtrA family protein [Grimontia sp. NTOU-MAR1]
MEDTNYAFVIPAFNPCSNLLSLVKEIRTKTKAPVIIVNDGSSEQSSAVFDSIHDLASDDVVILEHAINFGKGAALKTAFNHVLTKLPLVKSVVTLDADGQHTINDCMRLVEKMGENPESFVLGYRSFSKDIPLKSYIGNNISRVVYSFALGYKYKDTQTGLRGVTREFMRECLSIKSNRFEFETEQLALACRKYAPGDICEIPISTIYIENNAATSFRPLVDSFRIYFVLIRYTFSSILTALTDFFVFLIAINLGLSVTPSNFAARTASIGVQFFLLNKVVFKTKASYKKLTAFVLYVYGMGLVSSWLQIGLTSQFGGSEVVAKVLVESVLFFVNFAFVRAYIFTNRRAELEPTGTSRVK